MLRCDQQCGPARQAVFHIPMWKNWEGNILVHTLPSLLLDVWMVHQLYVSMSVCNVGCVWVFWYTSRCILWNFQKVWRGLCWGNCVRLVTRTLKNWWSCSLVSCQHYIKHFVRSSTIVNLYSCALWLLTETFSSMLPLQEMLQTSLFFVQTSITSLT